MGYLQVKLGEGRKLISDVCMLLTKKVNFLEPVSLNFLRLIFKETAPKEAVEANEAWKKFRETEARNETEATLEELQWANCLIFSIPTCYGNLPSQPGVTCT